MSQPAAPTPFSSLEKNAFLGKMLGGLGRAAVRKPLSTIAGGGLALAAANSTPGRGLMDTVAGKFNAGVGSALNGLNANWQGAKALLGGGDATKAKNDAWNAGAAGIQAQQQRADQGWNRATGYVDGAINRFAKPFAMAGAGAQGFSQGGWKGMGEALDSQSRASNGMIQAADKQVATGQLGSWDPAVATISQPPTPTAAAAPGTPGSLQQGPPASAAANPGTLQQGPPAPVPPKATPVQDPNPQFAQQYRNMPLDERMHARGAVNPPAPSAGPSPEQLAQFRKAHGSAYDPNSRMDRGKLQAMTQMGGPMLAKAGTAFASLGSFQFSHHMTPFAQLAHPELSKEANFAKLIGRGMTWAGRTLGNSAADKGGKLALNAIRESGGIAAVGGRGAASRMLSAGRLSGRRNSFIGQKLRQAGATIGRSQGLQKAINYGGGAALAGAGLYGANRMGYNSGVEAGIGQGLDAGMQAGVESAYASQAANQPGYLQGLWNGLSGQPSGGMNVGVAYGDLSNRRSEIMNTLMRSYAG